MYPIRKIRSDYQAINEGLFGLFGDKNIEGTRSEIPFLVAILWILWIPKYNESWRNTRGNGPSIKDLGHNPPRGSGKQSKFI